MMKRSCLPRAWAVRAIRKQATHFQTAANKQLNMKEVARMEVQLARRVVVPRFLIVTSHATDMVLRTSCINEIIEKTNSSESTLRPIVTSSVAIKENVGSAVNTNNNVDTKQGHPK